jgi:GAF domain
MKTPSDLDRETLQQLLANAFAVQQSQINTQTLSAIMDVQRSVASGKLDVEGAMRHIVESARSVANATGVAIALLKRHQLTYLAGSGSSAADVGQQVAASLTVAADSSVNREILRVENAQTDTRIEADICRQFGANALLILPIYQERAIAGVLDVRFSQAHAFQDREVRTYRLMVEQIEAALSHAAQLENQLDQNWLDQNWLDQKKTLAPEPLPIPDAFLPIEPPGENFISPPEFLMLPTNEHSLYARCGAVLVAITELLIFKQSTMLAKKLAEQAKNLNWPDRWRSSTQGAGRELSSVSKRLAVLATTLMRRANNLTWPSQLRTSAQAAATELSSVFKRTALLATQRAKNVTWPKQRRSLAVAAVAVVLAFTAWIAYRGRGSAKSLEFSTLPSSSAVERQAHLPKPLPGQGAPEVQPAPAPSKEAGNGNTALKRVRVSPHEVDYIGQDVTVRIFRDRPTIKRSRVRAVRISHLGDDVTVRYFTQNPPTISTASR